MNRSSGRAVALLAGCIVLCATPAFAQPPAPTNLTATAVSPVQINLTWVNNSTIQTGVRVERSRNGSTYTQIADLAGTPTSYSSVLLTSNTPYYYRVVAYDAGGPGPYSNVATATTQAGTDNFEAGSWLGGTGTTDAVRGAEVLSDGTLVIAANISNATPGGLQPILLNGANSTTPGSIIRLSSDGRTVLSVTRLVTEVWDFAIDGSDNLFIAAGPGGAFKLNAAASSILWSKTDVAFHRIKSTGNGDFVILNGTFSAWGGAPYWGGAVYVYNSAGTLQGSFAAFNKTYDVAIDGASQHVFLTGFQQYGVGGRLALWFAGPGRLHPLPGLRGQPGLEGLRLAGGPGGRPQLGRHRTGEQHGRHARDLHRLGRGREALRRLLLLGREPDLPLRPVRHLQAGADRRGRSLSRILGKQHGN